MIHCLQILFVINISNKMIYSNLCFKHTCISGICIYIENLNISKCTHSRKKKFPAPLQKKLTHPAYVCPLGSEPLTFS